MPTKRPAAQQIERWDSQIIAFFQRTYIPLGRIALFVVFFYFGILKFTGDSPASGLAELLVMRTVGVEWFNPLFTATAVLECMIGILFLIPQAARVVIPLLFFHLIIVSAPLVLLPQFVWSSFGVPTLEAQYIIKNIVIIAVAFGIAAHTSPLSKSLTK